MTKTRINAIDTVFNKLNDAFKMNELESDELLSDISFKYVTSENKEDNRQLIPELMKTGFEYCTTHNFRPRHESIIYFLNRSSTLDLNNDEKCMLMHGKINSSVILKELLAILEM